MQKMAIYSILVLCPSAGICVVSQGPTSWKLHGLEAIAIT